jgi:hypothetical protein
MSTELTAPTTVGVDPITTALVAAGVPSSRIEALAKDYGSIAADIQIIQSAEDYELVKRAQLACRDVRTAVIAALKEEREEAKRYQTFVISEEKRILAEIAKTEDPLKKLREDYDKREELKAQEEARQWVEKMNLRKQAAFDVGYYFNGQAYLLDRENGEAPWVLREDQIAGMAMSDEALYALLEAQAAELKMTREIKAEAEAKAEEERLAAEAEQRRKDEEAAAKLAEIELREKEMQAREAAMNTKVNEARKNELLAMGCEVGDLYVGVRAADGKFMDILQDVTRLYVRSDAEWESDKAQYAEKIKQRDEEARVRREQQLQREAAERAVAEERERVEAEHRRQEEEKERAAYKEAERIASMGDKGLVEQLSAYLVCAPVPDLHTAVGQHGMARVRKHLVDLTNMVNSIAKDL